MKNDRENRRLYRLNTEQCEAWYELGAPIFVHKLKFFISISLYTIDNYFLIKNTYNAVTLDEKEKSSYPQIIAGCTIGLHIISSIIISVIDTFNENALSSSGGKRFLEKKMAIAIRMLAHLTLTMKLLRYVTFYVENKQRNRKIHERIMRRHQVTKEEIQFVVDQKKNCLVESHYDLIESFFKTVPAALLQIYFMFKSNPVVKMRLYSTADQDRFATVLFAVITATISAANYQSDYLAYKKVLVFQDSFKTRFESKMNLTIAGDLCFLTSIPVLFIIIGTRVCFFCMLIYLGMRWFASSVALMMFISWIFYFQWTKTAWRVRPILENPLFGMPWICSDVIDLWIGLFIPGVHYQKLLHNFWNLILMILIGLIFDGLLVSGVIVPEVPPAKESLSSSTNKFVYPTLYNSTVHDESYGEEMYFIGHVVNFVIKVHDILTFNQMPYVEFFIHGIAYMGCMNVLCLVYVCVLNRLGYIDNDFPVQIYSKLLQNFDSSSKSEDNESLVRLVGQRRMQEGFVLFNLLTNAQFFETVQNTHLESVNLEAIRRSLDSKELDVRLEPKNKYSRWIFKKVTKSNIFPLHYRTIVLDWNIPCDIESIKSSIKNHPLKEMITSKLIDTLYNENEDEVHSNNFSMNKCLAVFCSQYYDICKKMTSYRMLKFSDYFSIDIGRPGSNNRFITDGSFKKKFYEESYLKRITKVYRNRHNIDDDVEETSL